MLIKVHVLNVYSNTAGAKQFNSSSVPSDLTEMVPWLHLSKKQNVTERYRCPGTLLISELLAFNS